jgi:hypothetical protein
MVSTIRRCSGSISPIQFAIVKFIILRVVGADIIGVCSGVFSNLYISGFLRFLFFWNIQAETKGKIRAILRYGGQGWCKRRRSQRRMAPCGMQIFVWITARGNMLHDLI